MLCIRPPNYMSIIAIDPSVKNVGYAIFITPEKVNHGRIIIKAKVIQDKLAELFYQITRLVTTHRPSVMVVEAGFSRYHLMTQRLAEARAICCLVAGKYNMEYHEYPPKSVKKYVTGYGNASKEQMIDAVRQIYNIKSDLSPDESDALGLGLYFFAKIREKSILESSRLDDF